MYSCGRAYMLLVSKNYILCQPNIASVAVRTCRASLHSLFSCFDLSRSCCSDMSSRVFSSSIRWTVSSNSLCRHMPLTGEVIQVIHTGKVKVMWQISTFATHHSYTHTHTHTQCFNAMSSHMFSSSIRWTVSSNSLCRHMPLTGGVIQVIYTGEVKVMWPPLPIIPPTHRMLQCHVKPYVLQKCHTRANKRLLSWSYSMLDNQVLQNPQQKLQQFYERNIIPTAKQQNQSKVM